MMLFGPVVTLSLICAGPLDGPKTLEQAILHASKVYNVDARLLKAISYIESSGGLRTGLRKNKNGTYDIGAFQINSVHWSTTCRTYDVRMLKGNALCAAKLVRKAMKYANKDPNWVGRYHSKTPKYKLRYAKKIKAFLK